MEDKEFYIGYLNNAPPSLAKFLRKCLIFLFLLSLGFGLAFIFFQNSFAFSYFEFGNIRNFQGKIILSPHPQLLVRRPALASKKPRFSSYLLVAPFKFGATPFLEAGSYANKEVSLQGTLAYRDNQTMIEVIPNSLKIMSSSSSSSIKTPTIQSLGKQTLVGEIVDSKCYWGVMKPASQKIHRACAIRCISGGIPPVLLSYDKQKKPRYFLLVSRTKKAINHQILDLVAKQVKVTGNLEKQGELYILRADPRDYQLLR